MAQNVGKQARQAPASAAAAPAILRQGRTADPALATAVNNAPAETGVASADSGQMTASPNDSAAQLAESTATGASVSRNPASDFEGAPDGNRDKPANRQRQLRLMMRQCDRVLLADYDLLAMENWPDNAQMSAARRRRDLWLLVVGVTAVLFAGGVLGVLPVWLGGAGFGAFVTTLLLALPALRRVFSARPLYGKLKQQRRQMLLDARRHVAHLEGSDGLAWQCARMATFNPLLASPSFFQLVEASERHTLVRQLTGRRYVRLYLFYMVEADKAYQRLQQAFLDSHQQGLEQGWLDSSERGSSAGFAESSLTRSLEGSANLTS